MQQLDYRGLNSLLLVSTVYSDSINRVNHTSDINILRIFLNFIIQYKVAVLRVFFCTGYKTIQDALSNLNIACALCYNRIQL